MNDSRYIDLDAYLAEQDDKPVIVKVFGEEWKLPSSPPADTMLRVQRIMAIAIDAQDRLAALNEDDEIPEDLRELASFDVRKHAEALLGADNLDAMLAKGLRQDGLMHLMHRVSKIHQGGDGAAPNRAARRKGGRSS